MANKRLPDIEGEHEALLYDEGEPSFHVSAAHCKKKGHDKFITAKTFCINDLPEQHRGNDLYNFIRSVADLTVKIDVTEKSPVRPDDKQELSRKRKGRHGTGRVSLVTRYKEGYDDAGNKHLMSHHVCRCGKCQSSNSPSTVWWDVEILTATHVVFDNFEASHAKCSLFYDEETSPAVTIDGVTVDFSNVERDWCRLTCVTCDRELGEKLCSMKKECNNLWKTVHKEFYNSNKEEHKLMFLVSHPHGGPKQISIGKWYEKIQYSDDLPNCVKFTYETSTCPGSSGATVYCPGYTGWWLYQLVHSRVLPESGLNVSSPGFIL